MKYGVKVTIIDKMTKTKELWVIVDGRNLPLDKESYSKKEEAQGRRKEISYEWWVESFRVIKYVPEKEKEQIIK